MRRLAQIAVLAAVGAWSALALAAPVVTNTPPAKAEKKLTPAQVAREEFERGAELLQNQSFTAAIAVFEHVLAITNFPEAHGNLGVALMQLGKLSRDPLVQADRWQAAATEFARSAELKPTNRMTYLLWSDTLVLLGDLPLDGHMRSGCYQGAVEKCRKVVEMTPDDWEANSKCATILTTKLMTFAVNDAARLGLYKEACGLYAKAAAGGAYSSDLANIRTSWGNALVQASRLAGERAEKEDMLKQALEQFDRATRAQPKSAQAWTMWGNACLELGRLTHVRNHFRDGVDRLNRGLGANPNDAGTMYNLACGYALMDNTVLALEMLKRCFELDRARAYVTASRQEPDLVKVRAEPQYEEMAGAATKLGLPAYNPPLRDGSR